jgi:phospholipid/cholesterol/gamma-HCH transport system substrate-binding protein
MSRNAVETVMGAVVLVVAAVFLFFAYTTTKVTTAGGNVYSAQFSRVDGIRDGTDVRVSGIKVGQVISLTLDPKEFLPAVKLSVDPTLKFSADSILSIKMSGLLGDKFVDIEPGNDDQIIPPGGRFVHTTPPFDLEAAVGQYMFSSTSKKDSGGSKDAGGGAQAPSPAPQGGNAPAAPQ